MDVLRRELNAIYSRQNLNSEHLDHAIITGSCNRIAISTEVANDCRVITDASADHSFIFGGAFARLIGISDKPDFFADVNSSDEDVIYSRLHPEDIVEKRMLELEFFKFVDSISQSDKLNYKATCTIRIKNRSDQYVNVDNSTEILALSPAGKIWLILCCYSLSPDQSALTGLKPRIMNRLTGEISDLSFGDRRSSILSQREKEVLILIRDGLPSKQIADRLGISIHTVNRHRQNILEKLSVGNSVEAITAATAMKLL